MSSPTHFKRGFAAIALAVTAALFAGPSSALAAPVNLGTASPFVVLAGSTATNTGPSVLNGDLGVSPGHRARRLRPARRRQRRHARDRRRRRQGAARPHDRLQRGGRAARLAGERPDGHRSRQQDAEGRRLPFTSSAQLTGPLTLDAEGDPNAQFVFEIGSALTTASASSVVLLNGANPCNVYWQVGSSATLGTTTAFQGNLMALPRASRSTTAPRSSGGARPQRPVTLINNVLDTPRAAPPAPTAGRRPARHRVATRADRAAARRCSRRRRTRRPIRSAPGHPQRHDDLRARRRPRPAPRASAARSGPADQARRLQPRRQADRQLGPRARTACSCEPLPGAHR